MTTTSTVPVPRASAHAEYMKGAYGCRLVVHAHAPDAPPASCGACYEHAAYSEAADLVDADARESGAVPRRLTPSSAVAIYAVAISSGAAERLRALHVAAEAAEAAETAALRAQVETGEPPLAAWNGYDVADRIGLLPGARVYREHYLGADGEPATEVLWGRVVRRTRWRLLAPGAPIPPGAMEVYPPRDA